MAEHAFRVPNFDSAFRHFAEVVYPRFNSDPFRSFRAGAARSWEAYKPKLRATALERLDAAAWKPGDVGKGRILDATIAAIEIKGSDQTRNNLVQWEDRYGPASGAHAPLVAARIDHTKRAAIEASLFELFTADAGLGDTFERLRELIGNRYAVLAYLFFLRDIERFTPIATQTFDLAFARLGIDLVTSGRCAWENYTQYNAALAAVQAELVKRPGLEDARLIDAHSFCWMMIRMEAEQPGKGKAPGIARHGSARLFSVVEMAEQAFQTAKYSNGQQVLTTKKNKELYHERNELRCIIERLIDKQQGRCALTGLPLQWLGAADDPAMLASLDRIDSNGHYVEGNLQVVCRFANQWKSSSPDAEFRRLLRLVRDND